MLKFTVVFALGIMVVIGMQAYQQSQLDDELFNSRYHLKIRLVAKSSAFEWSDMSTTQITMTNSEGDISDILVLYQPANINGRECESNLITDRWDWATYTIEVSGDDFDTFVFTVKPYSFTENTPWQISRSWEILYSDWLSSPTFIIWVGLGY